MVADGLAQFGRIDTLVNNAGIFLSKGFTQYTEADYVAVLGANITGFFYLTQLAIAEMAKQGSGHVVQITSSLTDHANSQLPAVLVALSKGGLNAATTSLAIEYARSGIRINAVSAGLIKSPLHPVHTHEGLAALHPVGRMGAISDVVEAVLYLESATFVTGEILHVDGGQSADDAGHEEHVQGECSCDGHVDRFARQPGRALGDGGETDEAAGWLDGVERAA